MMKNHGVKHARESKEIEEKAELTCLKNNGKRFPLQVKEIQKKYEQTCFENNGVKNISQLEENKKKLREIQKNKTPEELLEIENRRNKLFFNDKKERIHE